MPAQNDSLQDRLSRYREIKLTVTGRKSGHAISNPVWFVYDDEKLSSSRFGQTRSESTCSTTRTFESMPAAQMAQAFHAVPIADAKQVSSVVEKFRDLGPAT